MTKENEHKYLATHIANYFLWRADEEGIEDMTTVKLIKLVYFSYGWNLAIFDKKLFNERIEAWRYGPVIPSIYHEFKKFGASKIKRYAIDVAIDTGDKTYPVVDEDDENTLLVLNAVWNIYKDKNGSVLSNITHEKSSPWEHAYAQGQSTSLEDDEISKRAKEAILKYKDC